MNTYVDNGVTYVEPHDAADVTDEMLGLAEEVYDGWFDSDEAIDWEEFIDRLCNMGYLADGTKLEFDTYDCPAVNKIKRHIRNYRNL